MDPSTHALLLRNGDGTVCCTPTVLQARTKDTLGVTSMQPPGTSPEPGVAWIYFTDGEARAQGDRQATCPGPVPGPCGLTGSLENRSDGQLRALSGFSGREAVTASSKAEGGKDEGGRGVAPTKWSLEPLEMPPGCRLHGLHVHRKSLWDSGRGPSSHGAAPSGGWGWGLLCWPPRQEGKDQLSVMRVGTGHGDGGAHMGPRRLQPFPGVCGSGLWLGRLSCAKGGWCYGRQAVCIPSWGRRGGGPGGGRGEMGGPYRKGD